MMLIHVRQWDTRSDVVYIIMNGSTTGSFNVDHALMAIFSSLLSVVDTVAQSLRKSRLARIMIKAELPRPSTHLIGLLASGASLRRPSLRSTDSAARNGHRLAIQNHQNRLSGEQRINIRRDGLMVDRALCWRV